MFLRKLLCLAIILLSSLTSTRAFGSSETIHRKNTGSEILWKTFFKVPRTLNDQISLQRDFPNAGIILPGRLIYEYSIEVFDNSKFKGSYEILVSESANPQTEILTETRNKLLAFNQLHRKELRRIGYNQSSIQKDRVSSAVESWVNEKISNRGIRILVRAVYIDIPCPFCGP